MTRRRNGRPRRASHRGWRWPTIASGAAVAITVSLVAAGCGGGSESQRSVASYCRYFYGQGTALRNRWAVADNPKADPLTALATLLASPRELAGFFHQLSLRAPGSVAEDLETISSTYKQEAEQTGADASNPLGGFAAGLVNGLSSLPAYERVEQFTNQQCGPPPGAKWTGGGSSTSGATATVSASTTPTQASTEIAATATTTPSESGAAKIHFDVTTSEGWNYKGTLPLPTEIATFSKSASWSPPGSAKVEASVSGEPVSSATFSDDNPGRPGGPQLTVEPGYFAYKVGGDVLTNGNNYSGPSSFGLCSIPSDGAENGAPSQEPYESPTEWEVTCPPASGESSDTSASNESGPEAQVEHLVAQLKGERPSYVLDFDPTGAACRIFVTPSGTVEKVKAFATECGDKITASLGP